MHFSWDLPAAVLRRRPDVRVAEAQLQAAAARVTQTEAAARPQVALRMSSIWSAHRLATLGQTGAVSDLVAQVAATLWDDGGRRAAVDAQKASVELAAQALRSQLLVAMQSVESAWSASTQAHARWTALSQAQASAQSAAGLAAERYQGGVADFLAVLEAQRTLLNVQDAAVVARVEWWVQQIRLAQALGGAWGQPS
jgi:outer membrane protein TolC